MRIISQSGNVDYLYDNIVLAVEENCIVALYRDTKVVLAMYSNYETAMKVMDNLHSRYSRMDISVWQFPAEEDV